MDASQFEEECLLIAVALDDDEEIVTGQRA
jgi:hypothetical protein